MVKRVPNPPAPCLTFAQDYTVRPVDGLGVFFISERRQWLSTSRIMLALCPLVDGRRSLDDLMRDAAPAIAPAEVIFAVNELEKAGVVVGLSAPAPPRSLAAWHTESLRLAPGLAVQATDRASAKAIAAALARAGLPLRPASAEPPPSTALRLLVVTDYLDPAAEAMIATAEVAGSTWMPAKLAGQRTYFGPIFGPGLLACWPCVRERLRANRPVETWLDFQAAPSPEIGGGRVANIGPDGHALAGEIAAALRDGPAAAPGDCILEWDGRTGGLHRHPVTRRAACPRCGSPPEAAARALEPPRFRDGIPLRRRAGGYRVRSAAETCARLAPLVSDLTGHVASLERLDTAPGPSAIYAGAYLTVPRTARPAADDFHGVCLGKGRDTVQARASALCEAVERISAGWRADLPFKIASLHDLGATAIDLDQLWNFSRAQVEGRAAWNAATADPRRHVPEPLAPDRPIAWVRGYSLTARAWRWLPRDHCYANAPEPRHGRFNPNGHAAGSCLEEATLQAFLELVERDAVAIWWYNRLQRPGLDPRTAADPYVRGLARGFAAQGWRSCLLDLTSDLGIPCLAAVARAASDGRWCIGFGCHFETAVAIERAMSELAQLFRADGRDGPPPWAPGGDEAFLFTHGQDAPPDAPTAPIATLTGLIDWCRDHLASRGMEMIVLDQTHPDIGLPVVKVVVPGLRHFWPRFGPGRLYDVPVAMGWRTTPLAEPALNPVHLFL
jgi:bacteriocin biosynthesis cyclodehydratase domain-containing protein